MKSWGKPSNANNRRSNQLRIMKSEALRVFWGAIATTLLLLVSMAAAADIHLQGFEKNCGLCQFSQIALEVSSLVTHLPATPPSLLRVSLSAVPNPTRQSLPCHLCRAPPLQPLSI